MTDKQAKVRVVEKEWARLCTRTPWVREYEHSIDWGKLNMTDLDKIDRVLTWVRWREEQNPIAD